MNFTIGCHAHRAPLPSSWLSTGSQPGHLGFNPGRSLPERDAAPPPASSDSSEPARLARHASRFRRLIGRSPQMLQVYDMIERVAPTDATVLLVGESGTGKELVARTIHEHSPRRHQPFIAVNCGAIPGGLVESELFGHERGSFTGANGQHHGYFERASGGTLFLDEITEMSKDLQVTLLRVLETGKVLRVGGQQELAIDVRVIAASNQSCRLAVAQGKLREDLLYRLSVFPIHLPPLRDRGQDAQLLADHFLQQLNQEARAQKQFSAAAATQIASHAWPGNVRELENAIRRAFILADDEVTLDLPAPDQAEVASGPTIRVSVGTTIARAERQLILATLEHYEGDKRKAAQTLGISLKTLYNKLHHYEAEQKKEF